MYGNNFQNPALQYQNNQGYMGNQGSQLSGRGSGPQLENMILLGMAGVSAGSGIYSKVTGGSFIRGAMGGGLLWGRGEFMAGKGMRTALGESAKGAWALAKSIPWAAMKGRDLIIKSGQGFFGKADTGMKGFMNDKFFRRSALGHLNPLNELMHLKGMKSVGGAAMMGAGFGLNVGIIGYDVMENGTSPGIATAKFYKDLGTFLLGGKVGAVVGTAAFGPLGGIAGYIAGGLGLSTLTSNSRFNQIMGIPDFEKAAERATLAGQGYTYRNPFRPGSYGMRDDNMYAATLRQQSLQAIHKSPLNDRALLLGREASRLAGY